MITLFRFALLGAALASAPAFAAEPIVITVKDHEFQPKTLALPQGERVKLMVKNEGDTTVEFESDDLRVEKIIIPGGQTSVMVGPLKPGTYSFFDEYHPSTTGTVTVTDGKKD